MLMGTHFIIAKSVVDSIDSNKSFFISEKNFIYGNIKPDAVSKYVLKKHYMKESFDMILDKIKYLCSLTLDYVSKYFSISKLSQELGVICHFLCDFFCVAHSQRWEFKHSMGKHVIYERELASAAKEEKLYKFKGDYIGTSLEKFFKDMFDEYAKELSCKNDLLFSTYICNSITNYILDNILSNTVASYKIAACF